MLSDWFTDVEAKQGRTLSEKEHAEEIHFFVLCYADDARPAYMATSHVRCGLQRQLEAVKEEPVTLSGENI